MTKRGSAERSGIMRARTPFEVGILVAATMAVAAIVAGLVAGGVRNAGPPDVVATVAGFRASPAGDVVELRVRNDGGEAVQEVLVRVASGEHEVDLVVARIAKSDEERGEAILPAGTGSNARATVESYTVP